jgi:holliday junction DNA helicase RuvA
MYSYFKGFVKELKDRSLTLEVQGIGYDLNITSRDFSHFSKLQDQECQVFIYQHVKEDGHTLFGFATPQGKEMFKILIQINGIGPKIAMTVLSDIEIDALFKAVMGGDVVPLMRISGIGKKTAERMILELKDKFKNIDVPLEPGQVSMTRRLAPEADKEVRQALESLGYSQPEIRRMMLGIQAEVNENTPIEQIITLALRSRSRL